MGEGTQLAKKLKSLNPNRMLLMEIAIESKTPMHISQFSGALFARHALMWVKGDKDHPTGKWNASNIQREISMLLGCDMLTMVEGSVSKFDEELETFTARPIPKYYPDWIQRIRWDSVQHNGKIGYFTKRPARLRGSLSQEEHRELMDSE